jgi:hypothetical protein
MEMFERLTVALETQAQRVAAALKQVEAKTADANIEVQRRRDEASKMTRKRQRHVALPCEPRPRFMDPAEQTFDASALVVGLDGAQCSKAGGLHKYSWDCHLFPRC